MTDIKIDSKTGLPELPEGQYWHIDENRILFGGEEHGLIVSARKTIMCDTVFSVTTRYGDLTALEALRDRQASSYSSRSLLWGSDGNGLPDLYRVEVEISEEKRETIETTRKRFLRTPQVVETKYLWTGVASWESFETLFRGFTDEFTEEAIQLAAIAAVEDHEEATAEREFVERITGNYPPKTLEAK